MTAGPEREAPAGWARTPEADGDLDADQAEDVHPPLPAPPPELDPVIHAQPRLRIVVALATLGPHDRVAFPRLQELLGMTPGNLSTHLRKLEDAGYVVAEKSFRRRTPETWLSVTPAGRHALETYTTNLRELLDGAAPTAPTGPAEPTGPVAAPSSKTTRPPHLP